MATVTNHSEATKAGRAGAAEDRRMAGGRSDRARGEERLGWMLAGPALFVMLAVTAYPMARAIYQSLFSYRITTPDEREFVGLKNYWTVLTDSLWWTDVGTTVFITVVTVAVAV